MKNLKNLIKSKKLFILILTCCIISAFTIVTSISKATNHPILASLTSTNDVTSFLSDSINNLNSINNSITKCTNEFTINTNITVDILNKAVENLDNLKSSSFSIVIPDNPYPHMLSDFASCINSTQNLYKYCITALSYDNNITSSQVKIQLDTLIEECTDSYALLNNYNIELTFPDSSVDFCDKLVSYLSSMEQLTESTIEKNNKANTFITTYNSTLTNFNTLLENLQPIIDRIRDENRSLDTILSDLCDKETKFLEIRKEFIYCSIPSGYIDYYDSVTDVFSLYEKYLSSIKTAVIYEQSCSSYKKNKKNIDKNYDKAFEKYNDLLSKYNDLTDITNIN